MQSDPIPGEGLGAGAAIAEVRDGGESVTKHRGQSAVSEKWGNTCVRFQYTKANGSPGDPNDSGARRSDCPGGCLDPDDSLLVAFGERGARISEGRRDSALVGTRVVHEELGEAEFFRDARDHHEQVRAGRGQEEGW